MEEILLVPSRAGCGLNETKNYPRLKIVFYEKIYMSVCLLYLRLFNRSLKVLKKMPHIDYTIVTVMN